MIAAHVGDVDVDRRAGPRSCAPFVLEAVPTPRMGRRRIISLEPDSAIAAAGGRCIWPHVMAAGIVLSICIDSHCARVS